MSLAINKKRYSDWLIDIICLAVGLIFFYALWLGSYPLFTPEESRYSEVAREMIVTGDYIIPRINGIIFLDKPVLYYWLQAIAIHLFGIKEWALRFFPALFGVFGSIIIYIFGRRFFNRRAGLLAALILATSPLYFGAAHFANLDLEVAVLISSALLCLISSFQTEDTISTYFFFTAIVFTALAFLTKGLIGIVFPVMISSAWIFLLKRFDLFKKIPLTGGILIFIAIVLPWIILVQKANPKFLHYFFITQQVTRFLSTIEFNNKISSWFYIPVVFVGFFPWSSFLIQTIISAIVRIRHHLNKYPVELFLLLWIFIIFIFFSIPQSKTMGYILPIFPALSLLIGNYLSHVWYDTRQKAIGILSFIILSSTLIVSLFITTQIKWIQTYSSAFSYLYLIAGLLFITMIISVFLLKKKTISSLVLSYTICSVLLLIILIQCAPYLNSNTIKPLVLYLKTIMRPEDEVINYFRFHHDVPLYLGKKVAIVADWNATEINTRDNWMRELWYGMKLQKTDDWLIDDNTFWQHWNSNKRIFVFMHINYFRLFHPTINPYFKVGEYNNIVLLCNKPIILQNLL